MKNQEKPIYLFQYRWSVPILAQVQEYQGTKFVMLIKKLGLSRSVLSRNLSYLIEIGLLQKNPGHGHPMRPEYIFTAKGKRVGPACYELYKFCLKQGHEEILRSKWSALIISLAKNGCSQFSDFQKEIEVITSRSLSLELKKLTEGKYLKRQIIDSHPPETHYKLTSKAISCSSLIGKVL